jgi:zinc protease
LGGGRTFFDRYYSPANAVAVLCGNFDSARATTLIQKYFGTIPRRGDPPPVVTREPVQDGERRVDVAMEAQPMMFVGFHKPTWPHRDDTVADVIQNLLTAGLTSRLYRRLVYESRIAADVAAVQQSRELSGFFQVISTATPGHTLAELEEEITRQLEAIAASGPTPDELERSHAQAEAHFVYRVQTVGGFGGKSDQLNQYNVFVGDPGYFELDLERYRAATPESIRETCGRFLAGQPRVALSIVPRGRLDLALPRSQKVVCS